MSADLSLVLVTYRSSAVAPAAVASFREGVAALGLVAEVVIVDHSEDSAEAGRLHGLAPEQLLVRPNRGYAAGINAGVAATSGRTLVVANPDVVMLPGSLSALLAALGDGWGVVGPQFILAGLRFPPADLQTPGEQLWRWSAGRSRAVWARYVRREFRRWRSLWEADAPIAMPALSGALLAFRRDAFERIGPWDEGYFLYFEETDWLLRAWASGLTVAQVPAALVEHEGGHAADSATATAHFGLSRRRFLAKHYGWRGHLSARLRDGVAPVPSATLPADGAELPAGVHWWLLSPTALGVHAAGLRGTGPKFLAALGALTGTSRRPASYLALAFDPGARHLRGPWRWEGTRG